jgi:hypothetical protein
MRFSIPYRTYCNMAIYCYIVTNTDESTPNRAVAYFYCDYKDPETQNLINILGSLAAQLARLNENAFALPEELHDTCHLGDRPCIQPELSLLTKRVCELAYCFDNVSIIIEGLHECGTNTFTVVESIIGLATEDQINTRVLIRSRDIHSGLLEQQ